jgi:hypothetical protein
MANVTELIRQWHNKTISGFALMRGLVEFSAWEVPISESAAGEALASNTMPSLQLSKNPDGKICLLLFTSTDAFQIYRKANAITIKQHFLKTQGRLLFGVPMEGVDQVWIDPLSPHDIYYDAAQLGVLRECVNAIAVEEALVNLRQGKEQPDALQLVRDYQNYTVASTQHDGHPILVMAPDNKGRQLAAVFTADDAFDAFKAEMNVSADSTVRQLQLNGEQLFGMLQRMTLDGFVFNCAGPIKPVAFAQAVAGIVLEAR